jgi:hypothetical protein
MFQRKKMYLRTDSLGRHEIVDGEPTESELATSGSAQLHKLYDKFCGAYDESLQYKKPFKNPLTNLDMAWLYDRAATDLRQNPMLEMSTHDPTDLVFSAHTVLQDIDRKLENLRRAKIPIVGEKTKR